MARLQGKLVSIIVKRRSKKSRKCLLLTPPPSTLQICGSPNHMWQAFIYIEKMMSPLTRKISKNHLSPSAPKWLEVYRSTHSFSFSNTLSHWFLFPFYDQLDRILMTLGEYYIHPSHLGWIFLSMPFLTELKTTVSHNTPKNENLSFNA